MEHIVQFAISIDDEAIKRRVEHNLMSALVAELRHDVMNALSEKGNTTAYEYKRLINQLISEKTEELFSTIKDDIITTTSTMLSNKLAKTKKVTEAVNKLLGDI